MAIQYKTSVANSKLDAIDTDIGATGCLEIRSGSAPADCDTEPTGTVLAKIDLPATALAAAASGAISKSGTWETTNADATGTAGYFRIYNNQTTRNAANTIMQGTVSTSGADLNLNNINIDAGDTVTINTFTITEGNS